MIGRVTGGRACLLNALVRRNLIFAVTAVLEKVSESRPGSEKQEG